ncbi:MAG: polysaccharide export protein [Sphingomonadales bacterium]|nr:polysaccharide export protein [Sphingomonadales bacterium]MDE2567950.1 polysaccharide export protein [Sphingomonadales bacterium]
MVNVKRNATLLTACAALGLAGCSSSHLYDHLPSGQQAYAMFPPGDQVPPPADYRIRAGDEISVAVFQEPGLSVQDLPVDQGGHVQIPLVGDVAIAGMTTAGASREIEAALGKRYLKDPHVAVNVTKPAIQTVSVEGQVMKAGVFEITPDTTLLSAIAMAQSPTKIAKLDEVVIFRTIDGKRMAARFDLRQVRAGLAPDPKIYNGDVVVIGFSAARSVYYDILTAAPLFNVFTQARF